MNMDNFEKLFPKNLYHSYVIEGEPSTTATRLLNFLEVRGEIEKQSPDVLCQVYDSFTMDDKEEIKDWYNRLGISKSKKVCILATKFINREVEQTLLKMIEEMPLNSHCFIIVPDASILAGTILSRVHLIKTKKSNGEFQKEILDFISVSPKEKIDKITLIIKENKDEGNSGQLRYHAT